MSAALRALALLAPLWLGACTASPLAPNFDVARLEAALPQLAAVRGHRVGEYGPHYWVAGGVELGFVCRWPTDRAIPVGLEPGATANERALLARSLDLLGTASGLQFAVAKGDDELPADRGLRVVFLDAPAPDDPKRTELGAGDATADCRVRPAPDQATRSVGDVLDAELVRASVRVRRGAADALGRVGPLDDDALFAALLHELAHALGFGTHVGDRDSVLGVAPREVRRVARRLRASGELDSPTLHAFHVIPNGTIVTRRPATAAARDSWAVFGELALRERWRGPFTRAGQRSVEVFWSGPMDESGEASRFLLRAWTGVRREGEGLRWIANAAARAELARTLD